MQIFKAIHFNTWNIREWEI